MKHSTGKATKSEVERIKRLILEVGCICCRLRFGSYNGHVEIHHIVRGNKRLGHDYTLPLCTAHHRAPGEGAMTSIANGRKAFERVHGTELDLWLKVQHMLGLPDELPATKVLPRRIRRVESAMGVDTVPAGEASLHRALPQYAGPRAGDQEEAS